MELDVGILNEMRKLGHTRRFSVGDVIIRENSSPTSIFYVLHGVAAIRLTDWRDQTVILAYVSQGEFFGEMGLMPQISQRTASVIATSDVMVCELSYGKFLDLARTHQDIWLALLSQQSQSLLHANRRLADVGLLKVPERVREMLQELAQRPEAEAIGDGQFRLHISREELGQLVGCSREAATKALNALVEQGVVSKDGRALVIRMKPA